MYVYLNDIKWTLSRNIVYNRNVPMCKYNNYKLIVLEIPPLSIITYLFLFASLSSQYCCFLSYLLHWYSTIIKKISWIENEIKWNERKTTLNWIPRKNNVWRNYLKLERNVPFIEIEMNSSQNFHEYGNVHITVYSNSLNIYKI